MRSPLQGLESLLDLLKREKMRHEFIEPNSLNDQPNASDQFFRSE
jgi:hypothetical protein